jgi:hypothetical protein
VREVNDYKQRRFAAGPGPAEVTIAARVTRSERDALARQARLSDRSVSRELRRAIRFYIEHFDTVDAALKRQSEEKR